jgi:hypothetical protein
MLRSFLLFIRKRLPNGLSRSLKWAWLPFAEARAARPVPPDLVAGCRVCASRTELLKILPHGGEIVEVGTHAGAFARQILDVCNPKRLHLIDLDFSFLDAGVKNDPRVVLHYGNSYDVLSAFPDSHFDWVYIDADHSYAAVAKDAASAQSKVKSGGYLVFNDFAHRDPYFSTYGVHRAVVDFAVDSGWAFAWLAFEPNALYDVALTQCAARIE